MDLKLNFTEASYHIITSMFALCVYAGGGVLYSWQSKEGNCRSGVIVANYPNHPFHNFHPCRGGEYIRFQCHLVPDPTTGCPRHQCDRYV